MPTDWKVGGLPDFPPVKLKLQVQQTIMVKQLIYSLMLDDAIYNHGASQGDILNITGLVTYSYGTYKLIPGLAWIF